MEHGIVGKMTKINERFCGNCCWFSGEDHYGYGLCPFRFGDAAHCGDECTTNDFVSRKEMRHHMAVLLQYKRWLDKPFFTKDLYKAPSLYKVYDAIEFSVRYMKVFREL